MTVLADFLIGWGSLNALVLLVLTGVARRRHDLRARITSDRFAAARDPMPWVQRHEWE